MHGTNMKIMNNIILPVILFCSSEFMAPSTHRLKQTDTNQKAE